MGQAWQGVSQVHWCHLTWRLVKGEVRQNKLLAQSFYQCLAFWGGCQCSQVDPAPLWFQSLSIAGSSWYRLSRLGHLSTTELLRFRGTLYSATLRWSLSLSQDKWKLSKFLANNQTLTRKSLNRQFSTKSPKVGEKKQVQGSKIDQIRTKRPTATVGIHPIQANCYCRNPPIQVNSYCRNPPIRN